jgi:hypothetical protein
MKRPHGYAAFNRDTPAVGAVTVKFSSQLEPV